MKYSLFVVALILLTTDGIAKTTTLILRGNSTSGTRGDLSVEFKGLNLSEFKIPDSVEFHISEIEITDEISVEISVEITDETTSVSECAGFGAGCSRSSTPESEVAFSICKSSRESQAKIPEATDAGCLSPRELLLGEVTPKLMPDGEYAKFIVKNKKRLLGLRLIEFNLYNSVRYLELIEFLTKSAVQFEQVHHCARDSALLERSIIYDRPYLEELRFPVLYSGSGAPSQSMLADFLGRK